MSDSEDEFEDALEVQTLPSKMDLAAAIDDSKLAIHLFFNNKFFEAQQVMKPWVGTSMYHTIGIATFHFMEAVLTFERRSIEQASASLKLSIQLCNYYRRKNTLSESLGKIVRRPNYIAYTDEELHAELCFAEALLLKALLTFIEDETLVSFIKAGLKIRSCYNSYKECAVILNQHVWSDERTKVHFESGVRMGIGMFNLMISLLPGRVIKLLEFIGFSGSKEKGLSELFLCYNLKHGLRHVLSVVALLAYNLVIKYIVSQEEGDLEFCENVLKTQLTHYPEGAWFLYFKGRLELIQGNLEESIAWYKKSWRSQRVWTQFHHICFWELTWAHCMKGDWKEAETYAGYLLKESKWSRTIYGYQKACVMLMRQEELTVEEVEEVRTLMSGTPRWKQRIAGKSLPMEKFAIRKAERFAAQNERLVLPALELLYIWNYFKILSKKWEICDVVFRVVEAAEAAFEADPGKWGGEKFAIDNRALILLLKGSCLRHAGKPLQAERCFLDLLAVEKNVKYDTYVVPYALIELAFIYRQRGNDDKAAELLEDAKKSYTGYGLETRVHFLVHSELTELNRRNQP